VLSVEAEAEAEASTAEAGSRLLREALHTYFLPAPSAGGTQAGLTRTVLIEGGPLVGAKWMQSGFLPASMLTCIKY
jgi:hypothetical protein